MLVLSPTVQMHLLVFVFAVTGVLGHWLTLSATSLVAWRTFLAMIAMALWIMIRKKASIWISPK
jgi:ABC-type molybdate transport system permease subunit